MIIKNNFNSKDASPLNNYQKIGKGSNSLDRKLDLERKGFIKENIDNKIIQDIIRRDHEYEEDNDTNKDKWDFFR